MNESADFRWIMSYDDRARVRRLYPGRKRVLFRCYSVSSARLGRELMISSRNCALPVSRVAQPSRAGCGDAGRR